MQTNFTTEQLKNPAIAEAESILRKCVHCGFCTATCPTYVVTGDERDSPRGRIWMIRDLLQDGEAATQTEIEQTGHHLDRCLTCLSCMTTCPSGVDYMHLVDIGRAETEERRSRPMMDRLVRWLLSVMVPRPGLFRLGLIAAALSQPLKGLMPRQIAAMLALAPRRVKPLDPIGGKDHSYPAIGDQKAHVILLAGCAQRAIEPEINAATIRLLNRQGVRVSVRSQSKCCGALAHHINAEEAAHEAMTSTIAAFKSVMDAEKIDAVIVNTSGCGTTLKDYGHHFRSDPKWAEPAKQISDAACDITEFLARLPAIKAVRDVQGIKIGYHAACSLQHGQKITELPKSLLTQMGFQVASPKNPHLCCGSAGVYNVLQPELSGALKARKIETLDALSVPLVVAGNIGCINQMQDAQAEVVHLVQLLDWATGGPDIIGADMQGLGDRLIASKSV